VPLVNPDFAAYMQRVKDAKPAALMVFIPAGKTATAVLKAFGTTSHWARPASN
jgi:branched-chain amino acid transport system substrate-binding protein